MAARFPGLAAAALVAAVAVYLLRGEPDPGDGRVIYGVVAVLLLGATLSIAGSLAHDPWWRRVLFGFAGAIVLVMAWLGGLSFGPLLIPAIFLLLFAFSRG
jgi:hypothetical protein